VKKQQEKDAMNIGVQDGSRAATSEIEPSPQHWYVVRTAPRGEYLAAEELRRGGFEVILPEAKTPDHSEQSGYTLLFPGYLFVRCEADAATLPHLTRSTYVFGWLNFGGDVVPLPSQFVEQLVDRLDSMNREDGLWRRFRPGNKVRVISCGLQNLAEVLEEARSPRARVSVLMEFMGRLVSARVPWKDLQPTDGTDIPYNFRADKRRRRTRGKGRWIAGSAPVPRLPANA